IEIGKRLMLIIISSSLFASALSYGAAQMRGREIMDENRARWNTALCHDVRAFLAETQSVPETAASEDEILARARDFKARAFDKIPAKCSANYQLEIPTAHRSPC